MSLPRAAFFPKAEATVLQTKHKPPSPNSRPTAVAPILDEEHAHLALNAWSIEITEAVYPEKDDVWAPATIPSIESRPEQCSSDKYLFPVLTRDERLRLTLFFYYTRDVLQDQELMSRLQEKVMLAKETVGWEFVIAGLLNHNTYTRMVTVGLPLAVLPRRESTCSHTINQPPGTVFSLLNMIEDWRFKASPHVELGGLRAYAGVPLRFETEFGQHVAFGSLCVASNSPQSELSQEQQRSLACLADWIVADIIHSARARRQRERERMQKALTDIQLRFNEGFNVEIAIVDMLRTIYSDTVVEIHKTQNGRIHIGGNTEVQTSDLQHGLWEDSEYFDYLIETANHETMIAPRPIRVIAAQCASQTTPTFLTIGSQDFRNVFDDVDSWFVHMCAGLLCRYWQSEALKEALAAKELFLRGITHQLRTPIHGILGSVELLTEDLRSRNVLPASAASSPSVTPDAEQMDPHAYIKTIRTSARELISTVNSLIKLNQWTDIAQATRHVQLHTIRAIEAAVLNEMKTSIPEDLNLKPTIMIRHEFPRHCDTIAIDLRLLLDCVQPLVVNAIQNTPRGNISITLSVDEGLQRFTIDIEDNGRGIAHEHQGRIFDAYGKVDASTSEAGLGLTLACKSAMLLNGHVSLVASAVGEGSHFRTVFGEPICASSFPRRCSLAHSYARLPQKVHQLYPNSSRFSPAANLVSHLEKNGLAPATKVNRALLLFDYPADFTQLYRTVSDIKDGDVAVCLVPESAACVFRFDEGQILRQKNVVYVQGPFSSETFEKALATANAIYGEFDAFEPLATNSSLELKALKQPIRNESVMATAAQTPDHLDGAIPTTISSELTQSVQRLKIQTIETKSSIEGAASKTKPKVLLVDDNTVNLRLLELYCKRRGMQFSTAKDGAESVQVYRKQQEQDGCTPFDLVLMDLQMPVCDGISATQQIRDLENKYGWRKSVICMVTGQDSALDRANATEAGSDWYLVKPVGPKVLDRWIKEWFPNSED